MGMGGGVVAESLRDGRWPVVRGGWRCEFSPSVRRRHPPWTAFRENYTVHHTLLNSPRINLFSQHYREKYGQPVGKIALGLGRTCPNRLLGGCVYCRPASFTPYYLEGADPIATQLAKGRKFLDSRKFRRFFAYFQQETATVGPVGELAAAFAEAAAAPGCVGLIVSTRPDCLGDDTLAELARLGREREVVIELGLQSAHDRTLRFLNRNHTVQEFTDTARRVKAAGLALGVHLIVGLPGEELCDMLATVRLVVALQADAVKFHHLQVIKDTPLHRIFAQHPFPVLSPQEYLSILAQLLAHLPAAVVVHRLWSSSDPAILVAPHWGGLGAHQLHVALAAIMEGQGLWQGSAYSPSAGG